MGMRMTEVFVAADIGDAAYQRVLRGVLQYAQNRQSQWNVKWGEQLPPLQFEQPAGVIAAVVSPERADALHSRNLPVVNFSARAPIGQLPESRPDDHAIGRLAADFLKQRFHRSFAYVGAVDHQYAKDRLHGFLEALDLPQVPTSEGASDRGDAALRAMIASLPSGTAIFCANDYFARQAYKVCHALERLVPDDLSILGVDAVELLSLSAGISISSIDPNFERVGFEAARQLDRLLNHEPLERTTHLVAPAGVIEGRSTSRLACPDPVVRQAMELIRKQACQWLTVDEVVESTALSRRALERRFRSAGAAGIAEEIRRQRVHRACELLRGSDLPLEQVAQRSGFSSVYYFSNAFRKAMNTTPRRYRMEARLT